jgi:hypothetical protein
LHRLILREKPQRLRRHAAYELVEEDSEPATRAVDELFPP